MSQRANHPFIAKLVRQIEYIEESYMDDRFYDAWKIMSTVLKGLRPKHKKKAEPFIEKLEHGIESVERVTGLSAVDRTEKQIRLERQLDKGFQSEFMAAIWKGAYLNDRGYVGVIPTSTLPKEDEAPEKEPHPERLSEEIGLSKEI